MKKASLSIELYSPKELELKNLLIQISDFAPDLISFSSEIGHCGELFSDFSDQFLLMIEAKGEPEVLGQIITIVEEIELSTI